MAIAVGAGVQFLGWPAWLLFVIPVFGLTFELAMIERWNAGSLFWQRAGRRGQGRARQLTHAARRPL